MRKGIGPNKLGAPKGVGKMYSPAKQTMSDRSRKAYKQEESKFEQIGKQGKTTMYSTKDFKDPNVTTQPPTQEGKIGRGWSQDKNWQADYGKGAEGVAFNEKSGRIGAVKTTTVKKPLGYSETYREIEWDRRPNVGKVEVPRKKGNILNK